MKTFTIFYSWQSDRDRKCCKDFIRKAADAAASRVGQRLGVQVSIDADTEGVAGTPAISETILRKISECDLFLADMTFVAKTGGEKLVPNPNVMGEYGYALKAKGLDRILLAMNTAFGPSDQLPFDLRHLRHPAQYALNEDAADGFRRKRREEFSIVLERNIGAAIESLLKEPSVSEPSENWDEAEATLNEFLNSRAANTPVLVSRPKLMVWIVPTAALQGRAISAAAVKSARELMAPPFRNGVIADQNEQQWWLSDPPRRVANNHNPEATWCLRLSRPGFFEISSTIGERIDDDPQIVVQGMKIEQLFVDAVDRVAGISNHLDLGGPALITAGLEGIEDVEMLRPQPGSGGYRIRRPWASMGTARLTDFCAPTADHLIEMMERMWLIGGWDDGSPNYKDGHWTGYERSSLPPHFLQ